MATNDKMTGIKLSYDPDPGQAVTNTQFSAPHGLSATQKHRLSDSIGSGRSGQAVRGRRLHPPRFPVVRPRPAPFASCLSGRPPAAVESVQVIK